MKRLTFCMAVFATMALVSTAWAGKDKEESQISLELNLADGSRVIGTPSIESVALQTSYAKMDVSLKEGGAVLKLTNNASAPPET